MKEIFHKTFGGLTLAYYLRNLFFGVIIFIVFIAMFSYGDNSILSIGNLLLFIISTLLYPYAIFVWESISGFIIGNNTFFINIGLMFMFKVFKVLFCWLAAVFIAPLGLLYLYYYHSRNVSE